MSGSNEISHSEIARQDGLGYNNYLLFLLRTYTLQHHNYYKLNMVLFIILVVCEEYELKIIPHTRVLAKIRMGV